MNKRELIEDVALRADMTKVTARIAVDALLDAIATSLAEGKKISLVGFGHFMPALREARMGRNPQTGAPLQIKAATQVKFKPGKGLKGVVQEGETKDKAHKPRK